MFDGQGSTWQASLDARFHRSGERSLCANRHSGPLRMQKALYPEGDAVCHAVVIHPPGGIAGGDALELKVTVEPGAHALITTPGAAKWYKANGRVASQHVRLAVNGVLEWLPQEAIVFDAAEVRSSIDIDLTADAAMIGWDIVVLGRRAAGERYSRGCFAQTIRLSIDGELTWIERTRIAGGDALLEAAVGLAGRCVFGCLWAAGPAVDAIDVDEVRVGLGELSAVAPVTRLAPGLLVARSLGASTGAVRTSLEAVWSALRPRVCGRAARPPRLWAT